MKLDKQVDLLIKRYLVEDYVVEKYIEEMKELPKLIVEDIGSSSPGRSQTNMSAATEQFGGSGTNSDLEKEGFDITQEDIDLLEMELSEDDLSEGAFNPVQFRNILARLKVKYPEKAAPELEDMAKRMLGGFR